MEMTSIVYCPPLEEEEKIPSLDWSKDTIQYAMNNKSKIIKVIRSNTRGMNNINMMDIEDIYSEVLEYLYKSSDYDVERAAENSTNGNIVTLEGYVNKCVKNCTKRYITSTYRREKAIVRETLTDDEGKEKELLETIPDEKSTNEFNNIGYDVKKFLNEIEHKRYKYGGDIFLILYVRALTMDMTEVQYRNILEVLDIPKKELNEIEKKIENDFDILQAIKAISLCDPEEAIKVLEKEVYGAQKIKETIATMQ